MLYTAKETYNTHKAQRFSMALAIASICMAFAGLTSAYIVRKGAGSWENFTMPTIFYTSTIVIIISSFIMHVAHVSNKKGNSKMLMIGLAVTIALGVLFAGLQYLGWQELTSEGIYLDGNPSGSFFYVITGLHAVHVLGGVLFLIIALGNAIRRFKVNHETSTLKPGTKEVKIRTDLLSIYWHFMDILWIYLFVFLFFNLNH